MFTFNYQLSLYIPRISILPEWTISENPSENIKEKLWKLGKIDHINYLTHFDENGVKYYSAFIYLTKWDYFQDNISIQQDIHNYGFALFYYNSTNLWKLIKNDSIVRNIESHGPIYLQDTASNTIIATCLPVSETDVYITSLKKTISQQEKYIEQLEIANFELRQKAKLCHCLIVPEISSLSNSEEVDDNSI